MGRRGHGVLARLCAGIGQEGNGAKGDCERLRTSTVTERPTPSGTATGSTPNRGPPPVRPPNSMIWPPSRAETPPSSTMRKPPASLRTR